MEQPLLLTVSQFIASLNAALKTIEAKIIGEIITIKKDAKGHVYFTLKDKKETAVIDCAMWASFYQRNGIELKAGMEVILTGSANVYAPFGKLSFLTKTAELVGEGILKKAYEELKQKLMLEGVFAPERKRPLPAFPQNIGIITSKQGAVIHDFANNIGKHGFTLHFIDSRVEGKEALFDLLQAIKTMEKQQIDVLVMMRGGGSFQSLAAFDNEAVVRAITAFPVPVIAAIGHHQDVPLVALAADSTVSTPTAAANLVTNSWDKAEHLLKHDSQKILSRYQQALLEIDNTIEKRKQEIVRTLDQILSIMQQAVSQMQTYMVRIKEAIGAEKQKIKTLSTQLVYAYTHVLQTTTASLEHFSQINMLNDPMRLLKQGYSMVKKNGQLVRQTKNVTIGEQIEVLLSDGTLLSTIEHITNKQYE